MRQHSSQPIPTHPNASIAQIFAGWIHMYFWDDPRYVDQVDAISKHVSPSAPEANWQRMLRIPKVGQDDSSTAQFAHSNDVGLHAKAHPTEYQMEGPQFVGQASKTPHPIGQNLKCGLPGGPLHNMQWVKQFHQNTSTVPKPKCVGHKAPADLHKRHVKQRSK